MCRGLAQDVPSCHSHQSSPYRKAGDCPRTPAGGSNGRPGSPAASVRIEAEPEADSGPGHPQLPPTHFTLVSLVNMGINRGRARYRNELRQSPGTWWREEAVQGKGLTYWRILSCKEEASRS